MRSAEDVDLAVRSGVDAVGFITDVPVDTPRKIGLQKARGLIARVPFFVDSVLVIMPGSAQEAIEMIRTAKPDVVQIHSSLDIEDMRHLRANTDVSIIRTFHVQDEGNLSADELGDEINMFTSENLVDGILLDSYVSGKAGGTGQLHDLSVSKRVVDLVDIPVILAGGLNPDNVKACVEAVMPFAVDTASGVETDGCKDVDKVAAFVNAVRCVR
jgi:phosphoribosylanthranilate isomerase